MAKPNEDQGSSLRDTHRATADSAAQWQPIGTAPKGGWDAPQIIVWGPDCPVQAAEWHPRWYLDESKAGWITANTDEEYGYLLDPTHWMPMPAPPTPSGES